MAGCCSPTSSLTPFKEDIAPGASAIVLRVDCVQRVQWQVHMGVCVCGCGVCGVCVGCVCAWVWVCVCGVCVYACVWGVCMWT